MILVKITVHDDGVKEQKPKWCLAIHKAGGWQTLCTGEFYGIGESSCKYLEKKSAKGGITCQSCLDEIKFFKAIKL